VGDHGIQLVDLHTGKTAHKLAAPPVAGGFWRAKFSPDGQWLAVANRAYNEVSFWEVATGRPLRPLQGHPRWIEDIGFSADGRCVRTAMVDGTIKEWDAAALDDLILRGTGVVDMVVNPQGTRVVQTRTNSGKPSTLHVRDFAGREVCVFGGHRLWVFRVEFLRDGLHVVSFGTFSKSEELLVWNSDTGKVRLRLDFPFEPSAVALGFRHLVPGGKRCALTYLAGEQEAVAYVVDIDTGKARTLEVPHHRCFGFSPDDRWLLFERDGGLRVWDAEKGKEHCALAVTDFVVRDIAFDASSHVLAVYWCQHPNLGVKHEVRVYDLAGGKEQWTVPLGDRGLWYPDQALAFSGDGKFLAVSDGKSARGPTPGEPVVRVLDGATGKEVLALRGHKEVVQSLAFSPNGKRLVTLAENELKLWDMTTGHEVLQLPFDHGRSVSFSPDGHFLIGVSKQGGVKRWDATPLP
jgi:WD40 repeat protein